MTERQKAKRDKATADLGKAVKRFKAARAKVRRLKSTVAYYARLEREEARERRAARKRSLIRQAEGIVAAGIGAAPAGSDSALAAVAESIRLDGGEIG